MAYITDKNSKKIAQALFMLVMAIFVTILLLGVAIFQANAWAQANVYREGTVNGYSLIDDSTEWTSPSLLQHKGITLIYPTIPSGHHDGPGISVTNTSSEDFLFIVPVSGSVQIGSAGSFIFPLTVPEKIRRISINISTDDVEILGIGFSLVKGYNTLTPFAGIFSPSQPNVADGIAVIGLPDVKAVHGGTSKSVSPYAAQITINLSLVDHNRLSTGGYKLFFGVCVDDASYDDNADIVYVGMNGYALETRASWLSVDALYGIFGGLLMFGGVVMSPAVNPFSKTPFQWPIPGNAKPKKGGK